MMNTEEKKDALRGAGIKFRSNASAATIDKLYDELTSEPEPEEATADPIEEVEPEPEPEPATEPIKPAKSPASRSKDDMLEEFMRVHEEFATPQQGFRTPEVFEWADANLPADMFNEYYAGKMMNEKRIEPK